MSETIYTQKEREAARTATQHVARELFGCCSYQATYQPGIDGWGANDEESYSDSYVATSAFDELQCALARAEARVVDLEACAIKLDGKATFESTKFKTIWISSEYDCETQPDGLTICTRKEVIT